MTTLEEAKRCPICKEPGEHTGTSRGQDFDKSTVNEFTCKNERCRWFETSWLVQVRPDGSIAERAQGARGQDKQFNPMSNDALARGQRMMEDIQQEDLRDR